MPTLDDLPTLEVATSANIASTDLVFVYDMSSRLPKQATVAQFEAYLESSNGLPSSTKAQFDTACSDGNFVFQSGSATLDNVLATDIATGGLQASGVVSGATVTAGDETVTLNEDGASISGSVPIVLNSNGAAISIKSANGTTYLVTVSNIGVLTVTAA